MFATGSDCSFVVILIDFEPAGCGIYHSDTSAYKVCLTFSANGILWANAINAHLIPRYGFPFLGGVQTVLEVLRFFS
jgi:hypothetical protein